LALVKYEEKTAFLIVVVFQMSQECTT